LAAFKADARSAVKRTGRGHESRRQGVGRHRCAHGRPAGPDENKALVASFYKDVFQARNAVAAAKYLRQDYIQHNPYVTTGLAGFRNYFSKAWAAPAPANWGVEVLHVVAENDLVVAHVRWTTTADDGKPSVNTAFDLYRVQDGKLAEHWDAN
jgi:predicted SnoaL-like aldol condensation-catalyzing enzyme